MREWYTYENEIRAYSGDGGHLIIPTVINGHTITIINSYAFSPLKRDLKSDVKERRSNIQSVIIEDGYGQIRNNAFEGCINLSSIELPNSIQLIGQDAFSKTGIKTIHFPSKIKMEGGVCSHCDQLESVEVDNGISTLGTDAFWGCSSLVDIKLPQSINKISDGLFGMCLALKSIDIPENVEEIGDYAFKDCALEEIRIPSKVTKIGAAAFEGCNSLKRIVFEGENVISIGERAFSGCKNLEEMVLPRSVRWLYGKVFCNCKKIRTIEIPINVDRVQTDCFIGADSLEKIIIKGKETTIVESQSLDPFIPSSNLCICAPQNSFAEKYAHSKGICFKETSSDGELSKEQVLSFENVDAGQYDDKKFCEFMNYLHSNEDKSGWNTIAYMFSKVLLQSPETEQTQEAFEYLCGVVMHGEIDTEKLRRVAKNAQYELDFNIGSTSGDNLSYKRLIINLAKHFCSDYQ